MSSGFQVHQDLPYINALPKPIGSWWRFWASRPRSVP